LVTFFQQKIKKSGSITYKIPVAEKKLTIKKNYLKKIKYPLYSSITSSITILKEEIIKIAERDLEMGYFETSMDSVKLVNSTLYQTFTILRKTKKNFTGKNIILCRNIYLFIGSFILLILFFFLSI